MCDKYCSFDLYHICPFGIHKSKCKYNISFLKLVKMYRCIHTMPPSDFFLRKIFRQIKSLKHPLLLLQKRARPCSKPDKVPNELFFPGKLSSCFSWFKWLHGEVYGIPPSCSTVPSSLFKVP